MARSVVRAGAVCGPAWAAAAYAAVVAIAGGGLVPGTPRGTWLAVLAVSLLAVLGLACALPWDRGAPGRRLVVAGVVCGIAWGASMRTFMAVVAGPDSVVTWLGTFGFILLTSAVVGGLLGYAEHRRRLGRPRPRLRFVPLIFAVDPSALLLVLPAMAGGWALAGRGTRARRRLAWAAMVVPVVAFLVIVALIGDVAELLTPDGVAATVLLFSGLGVLTLAASIPYRDAPRPGPDTVEPRSTVGAPG